MNAHRPEHKAEQLQDAARRECAEVLLELPETAELPKSAVLEMLILAWIRGASWERGVQ